MARDLRAEDESLGQQRVEQRLDAEPVAGEHELPPARVPDGEGEHPVEAGDAGRTLLLVEVQDRLGVGARAVRVALGLELGAQRLVVVDLAVVGDPDRAVLVGHGLVAGGRQVDDRQPAMAQRDPLSGIGPRAVVVGAAMALGRRHVTGDRLADGKRVGEAEDSADPTHVSCRAASPSLPRQRRHVQPCSTAYSTAPWNASAMRS